MDFKEFFRPTIWKIVVTLTLLLIFHNIPIVPCVTGTVGSFMVRDTSSFSVCALPYYFSYFFITMGHYYDYFGLANGEWLAYIYVIIISYLLASLILLPFKRNNK